MNPLEITDSSFLVLSIYWHAGVFCRRTRHRASVFETEVRGITNKPANVRLVKTVEIAAWRRSRGTYIPLSKNALGFTIAEKLPLIPAFRHHFLTFLSKTLRDLRKLLLICPFDYMPICE